MDAFYQLWDTTTGNLVTEFDTEDEAIEALLEIQAEEGDDPILEYGLLRFQNDHPTLVARERDLVAYLERARERRVAHVAGART
jgi:hypothetical protein